MQVESFKVFRDLVESRSFSKAASLNLQGNVSVNGCFGFIVGTAVISGSASFSSCSALQGTAFSTVLAQ